MRRAPPPATLQLFLVSLLLAQTVGVQPASASSIGVWSPLAATGNDVAADGFSDYASYGNTTVVASVQSGTIHVQYSLDAGATWHAANVVTTGDTGPVAVAVQSATTWFVLGSFGSIPKIYRTTDSGNTWAFRSQLPTFTNGNQLTVDLQIEDETGTLLAAATTASSPTNSGCCCTGFTGTDLAALDKSGDGGGTWTLVDSSSFSGKVAVLKPHPNHWAWMHQTGTQTYGGSFCTGYINAGSVIVRTSSDTGATWASKTLSSGVGSLMGSWQGDDVVALWNDGTWHSDHKAGVGDWDPIVNLNAAPAAQNGQILQAGQQLVGVVSSTGSNPGIIVSTNQGRTWSTEQIPAGNTYTSNLGLVAAPPGLLFLGFDTTKGTKLFGSHRELLRYESSVRDHGATYPRLLVDLDAGWNYPADVYAREIGDDQLGTNTGRIFHLGGDTALLGAKDPCTGDYSAPGALRGLRVAWDGTVVTVCQNTVQSPALANLRTLRPDLTGGSIYGYAQTDVAGPFLIRSSSLDRLAYSTFDVAPGTGSCTWLIFCSAGAPPKPGHVRFDHGETGTNVGSALVRNILDSAVDEGTFQTYAAINATGVYFFNQTNGALLDSFDDTTFHTAGNSLLVRGPEVVILNPQTGATHKGVTRWNYQNHALTVVSGVNNPLSSTTDFNSPTDPGVMKWSKDHQYLLVWSRDHVWILNGFGLGSIYETPRGLFDGVSDPIQSVDMDSANNYLYVGTFHDVFRLPVYNFTTSTGDDFNPPPPGGPNSPPSWVCGCHPDPRTDDPSYVAPEANNTIPATWWTRYFNATTGDANADPDGDGYTNAEEYNAGTDPTNPADHPSTHAGDAGGAGGTIDTPGTTPAWLVPGVLAAAVLTLLGLVAAGRRKPSPPKPR